MKKPECCCPSCPSCLLRYKFRAKPRDRAQCPRTFFTAHVENRIKVGVRFPTDEKRLAVVYFGMFALVHTKWPYAPEPLRAPALRNTLTIEVRHFSNSRNLQTLPGRVRGREEFWLSPTGRPASVVIAASCPLHLLLRTLCCHLNCSHDIHRRRGGKNAWHRFPMPRG